MVIAPQQFFGASCEHVYVCIVQVVFSFHQIIPYVLYTFLVGVSNQRARHLTKPCTRWRFAGSLRRRRRRQQPGHRSKGWFGWQKGGGQAFLIEKGCFRREAGSEQQHAGQRQAPPFPFNEQTQSRRPDFPVNQRGCCAELYICVFY